jgi:hypothetical protein
LSTDAGDGGNRRETDKTIGGVFHAVETSAEDVGGANGIDSTLSSDSSQLMEWDVDSVSSFSLFINL